MSSEMVKASTLGGGSDHCISPSAAPVTAPRSAGWKVMTDNGWFAACPSGTEEFTRSIARVSGAEHREKIEHEAVEIVTAVGRQVITPD
ncbi:hypothetical protein M8494_37480 [Serratia ureilytica]